MIIGAGHANSWPQTPPEASFEPKSKNPETATKVGGVAVLEHCRSVAVTAGSQVQLRLYRGSRTSGVTIEVRFPGAFWGVSGVILREVLGHLPCDSWVFHDFG